MRRGGDWLGEVAVGDLVRRRPWVGSIWVMGERRKVRTARYDGEVGAVIDHVTCMRYIAR
jgi:hypothetical protein